MCTVEERIGHLKARLAKIDTRNLLEFVSHRLIPCGNDGKSVAESADIFHQTDLPSPSQQYRYLIGLLLSTDFDEENEVALSSKLFRKLEKRINDITKDYLEAFVRPVTKGEVKAEEMNRLLTSLAAFSSYYDMGNLGYLEQIINKIDKLFSQFDAFLFDRFSLTTKDLINIFNSICELDQRSVDNYVEAMINIKTKIDQLPSEKKKDEESFVEALNELGDEFGFDPAALAPLMEAHVVSSSDLCRLFGKEKTSAFLSLFSIKRGARKFQYYVDGNPFAEKPMVEVEDGKFFITYQSWLIEAIYDLLNRAISQNDSFARAKGAAVENLALGCFHQIFGEEATYYQNVCESPKTKEHDILIEFKDSILIVEVKGSKVKPPMYNPEKSYPSIKDHFFSSSGIGGAYRQAIRLKELLESSNHVTLYSDFRKPFQISCSGKKVYPIVITLENFGQIAINTSSLITPENNQPFPWACCLDDLEDLIKINKFLGKNGDEFIEYIRFRLEHHKTLFASDELEILEHFYQNAFEKKGESSALLIPSGNSLIDKIVFEERGVPYEYIFKPSLFFFS